MGLLLRTLLMYSLLIGGEDRSVSAECEYCFLREELEGFVEEAEDLSTDRCMVGENLSEELAVSEEL